MTMSVSINDGRLPKAVFCVELATEKRLHGGQWLRFKDVLKRHLKATHIAVDTGIGRLLHKNDNSNVETGHSQRKEPY